MNQFPGASPESFALKRQPRPCPEVVISTQPPRNSGRVVSTEHTGSADSEVAPLKLHKDQPPRTNQDTSAIKRGQDKGPNCREMQEPAHPYATVPNAINGSVPGPTRPTHEPEAGKHKPAYWTTAKIHDPQVADTVYEWVMETLITVTQRELLSLAPEVRARVADVTVKKRVPRDISKTTSSFLTSLMSFERQKRQKSIERTKEKLPFLCPVCILFKVIFTFLRPERTNMT